MPEEPSAHLVARWRNGDQQAAAELFRRYAHRLVALARRQLPGKLAQRVDPEDVVQSVYRCFFANARDDRYELKRGGDLWRLLAAITLDKLRDQVKWNTRAKRTVKREQALDGAESWEGIQLSLLARQPSPVEALALAETLQQVMRPLEPLECRILELRLQGHNLEEIAVLVERSLRTVCRVLDRIKQQLEEK
jgi:RNA polymerase sigma-70 factor (ECF subfamily)